MTLKVLANSMVSCPQRDLNVVVFSSELSPLPVLRDGETEFLEAAIYYRYIDSEQFDVSDCR